MQVHEDTFKHQVRELHRLYSVQKMLMEELRKEIKQTKKYWSPMATPDIIQSSYQYSSINVENLRDDPSPRERSGSCSGENIIRIARGLDLERPAEEDISTAVSVVDDNIPYKDTEVELTLSIGGSTSKKRASLNQEPGNRRMKELDFPAERAEDCSGPTTPMSSSSTATFDHERKQPHWLFQGLSINRTG
ncbi:hypothetical protein JCGZ_10372 [Jatropha curcas]|uniref:Uncharacterized protein n=2 Tax=Jatropha curcas TaxID=180498 RepID=A0A067KK64_JATCU|nr:hypothetical protein JCGZ_10372 [Jatropha curcas]